MKKRVALVIPTLRAGGAERVISLLANKWASEGHDVHVIILHYSDCFYVLTPEVKVHHLQYSKSLNFFIDLKNQLGLLWMLRQTLSQVRPSFVLSFLVSANLLSICACRSLGMPAFVSERSSPNRKYPIVLNILRRAVYPLANGVIVQTKTARNQLLRTISSSNIIAIPNPVKIATPVDALQKENVILAVGRLIELKGHRFLLDAFAQADCRKWKLVILGEGPERNSLESQANKLGIRDRLFMPGQLEDIASWLQKSSLFVLPSLSEGFPNALLEAMSSGLPCISFDCVSGPGDLIVHGASGLLVQVGDVEGLSRSIEALVNNETLRKQLGEAASVTAKRFDIDTISRQYFNFCVNEE